jgi:putative SOS response-associated peptidase YedK
MCNLYTLAPWEVRHLLEHRRLVDQALDDVIRARNEPPEIYPNYMAPVVRLADGQRTIEPMRWGFPPPPFTTSKAPVTNVRSLGSSYWRPWFKREQRCIVPAMAFAEPDRNTSKPVVFRWFARADGLPFYFAGIWRDWEGDRGTKAKPNVARHRLYAFLTTEPNGIVEPIHSKAMPVLLTTPDDVERWLQGTSWEDALELQRPAAKDAVAMLPPAPKAAA